MPSARRLAVPIVLALLLVTVVPARVGFADAATSRWAANCALNVRARPTTLSPRRTVIATNTLVTVSGTVSGGAYMTTCRKSVSGASWLAITAIGGRSVSTLFGVKVVYAASALFRSTATTATIAATITIAATGPVYGIDISRWNGLVDFARVRQSGKRFVIAKATEGRLYTDDAYARNRAGAMAAGLAFTAYHFAHPDPSAGDATREADHFITVASLRHGMLVPALDLESGQVLGTAALQTWVKTWLRRVNVRLGVKPIIYTTPGFWQSYMGNTRWFADNGYQVVWVAHWDAQTPATPASNWSGHAWTFWQYSSCGTVPGVSGCVDLDRFGGTDLSKLRY
jgi:GH25 family lysozyme M1 (1,4-beta-N-acetylmuramidase)